VKLLLFKLMLRNAYFLYPIVTDIKYFQVLKFEQALPLWGKVTDFVVRNVELRQMRHKLPPVCSELHIG